ncbi:CACTA en-spm transposon protein [Cucumis melo var. makuwa]|uniref:CACTA en-spm transposon protein n=1 Tax=Cucumis melo var. makuwa TaxID=1194695 RepID=A0A5A7SPA5_CUCMM|nr:CACTA en-spm transposon protein [Cucumis melo var. makuwa]TYK03439.1 CACTA en-spm transposon protein [Cucumis melo var. makuwa]
MSGGTILPTQGLGNEIVYETDVGEFENIGADTGDLTNNNCDFTKRESAPMQGTKPYMDLTNKRIWNVPEVDDVANAQLNVLEIIVGHGVDESIENGTLCRTNVDPIIVGRPVECHVANDFIDDGDQATTNDSDVPCIMSSFSSGFEETHVIILELDDDLNTAGRSSSRGDNSDESLETTRPSSTPRRCVQSRLLELERYIHANGRIPISIAPSVEKPILPHIVWFSQAIDGCVRKTFPVHHLRWADVGREYIEVVKGDLQCFFMLDFNDQAMNRFVKHQMLTCFKKFRGDCRRHFEKYSNPEEAHANQPHIVVERVKN